jgi:hypothetical protein
MTEKTIQKKTSIISILKRREPPIIVTLVSALFVLGNNYLRGISLLPILDITVENWATLVIGFALIVASVRFYIAQIANVRRSMAAKGKKLEVFYSGWVAASFALITVIGLGLGTPSFLYMWFYNNVYSPLGVAAQGLLAFMIVLALYRFKIKNLESTFVAIACIAGLLGLAPLYTSLWGGFTFISNWIINIEMNAAMLGITLGISIGTIASSIRTLFGMRRM